MAEPAAAHVPASALILVCVLPTVRDYEIARVLGWYRIPVRRAPKVIGVDYLAFYQPGTFGSQRRSVNYVAALKGYELTTRLELLHEEPDHPRAQEEYFKLSIDGLMVLPNPIRAGNWLRFTFLYTTGGYLQAAETLQDLVLSPDDRPQLWRSLRERLLQADRYRPRDIPDLHLDSDALADLLGIIGCRPDSRS